MAGSRGGSFGGGRTGGGGASGSWDEVPVVKCDGQAVGTVLYPNCSDYRGNSTFNYQHAIRCSKTCRDNNGTGYWMWAVIDCERDYQLVNGECKLRPCRERRATRNGRACCDTGADGRYDAGSDSCICRNNLNFVIENSRGYCREPVVPAEEIQIIESVPVIQYECDAELLAKLDSWRVVCANNADIMGAINAIDNYCSGTDINADGLTALYNTLMELNPDSCESMTEEIVPPKYTYQCDSQLLSQVNSWRQKCSNNASILAAIANIDQYCIQDDKNADAFMALYNSLVALNPNKCNEEIIIDTSETLLKIKSIIEELNNIQGGFGKSVWKKQDGGFNTARLASDSVAGIVLGTVGGIVTSNIIKKNQVSGGLENIRCTVAGQTIGGYGDEIVIGVR